MRTTFGSILVPAVICALIWIVISFATGGSALFSLGGGIGVGLLAFIVGYAFRRLFMGRRGPVGQPPAS
jgi:hypothetical protein